MGLLKRMSNKGKVLVGALGIAAGSFLFSSYSDGYFEISKNLDVFTTLYKELNIFYVDETKPGELMKTGIDAMLESLDPYTVYYPESQIEDFRFMTTGQYGGIGSLIRKSGDFVVIAEPYEGFPAHKAGLRAGDKILEIEGQSAEGKTSSDMSNILKGQPKTELSMKVERPGVSEPIEVTLEREEIKIKDVPYFGLIGDKVGYIKLNSFTETASKEVKEAFKKLKSEKQIESVVLDLRGNGGGLLREAVNIVNIFVPKGQEVVYTKGKVKDWDRSHKTINAPVDTEIPLVVLIDGGSASASEIVAGTIQDLDRGVVIGQNSFGKGLVQQTRNLSYNTKLKVTVAKYYTPSGRCIQRLDYSNKDGDGHAVEVPDSLRTVYKTKGGREVLDGAGIEPDVEVEIEKASPIIRSLVAKNLLFDYATDYRLKHDSVVAPENFQLSDTDYTSFMNWLSDKDYEYTTRSEKLLDKLEAAVKKDKYYEELKTEFEAFENKVKKNKAQDLMTHKKQIKRILENEIISRYYYQTGRIKQALPIDEDVIKAVSVLNDQNLYSSVLDGSYKGGK